MEEMGCKKIARFSMKRWAGQAEFKHCLKLSRSALDVVWCPTITLHPAITEAPQIEHIVLY